MAELDPKVREITDTLDSVGTPLLLSVRDFHCCALLLGLFTLMPLQWDLGSGLSI